METILQPVDFSSEKLPLWRKIGYGVGDIYGGGSLVVVSFFYLIFLTDVVLISPALAGTVILISKVYDSITDPFEGVLSDRTRTSLGRRRPYLLAGIPLVFLSFVALFYPYSVESELARFALVIVSYLFFSTVVSIVMLNYNALQSEITLDYNERTSLSSIRIFFSMVASLIAALFPYEIVKQFPDERQGYIVMGAVFGAFFALPFIFTFFSVRERKDFQKPPEKFYWRAAFIEPFKVKTFVYALFMYLFAFVAIDTLSNIVVFFMKYYLLRGDEANYIAGTLLVFQVISIPFFVWLSKRTSKSHGFAYAASAWLLAMMFGFFLGPGQPFLVIYTFAAIVGLASGGVIMLMYAIFPDIPDVDELVTGERREGIYSALVTLIRKMSSAVAIFFVGLSIDWAGYLAPVEENVQGISQLVDQPQSDSFILILRLIFVILPVVFLTISIAFARRYPLAPDIHHRLNQVLNVKRGHGEETAAIRQEADELQRLLV